MGRTFKILLGTAALALAGGAAAQQTITTPEGAQMTAATDLAYKLKLTPPSYEGTFVW